MAWWDKLNPYIFSKNQKPWKSLFCVLSQSDWFPKRLTAFNIYWKIGIFYFVCPPLKTVIFMMRNYVFSARSYKCFGGWERNHWKKSRPIPLASYIFPDVRSFQESFFFFFFYNSFLFWRGPSAKRLILMSGHKMNAMMPAVAAKSPNLLDLYQIFKPTKNTFWAGKHVHSLKFVLSLDLFQSIA